MRYLTILIVSMLSCDSEPLLLGNVDLSVPANDAAPASSPLSDLSRPDYGDAGITCGNQTCGPNQYCFEDCCFSDVDDCFVEPAGGCPANSIPTFSCNGVLGACLCTGPAGSCPPPPPCPSPSVPPQCLDIPVGCNAINVCDCRVGLYGGASSKPCQGGGTCYPELRTNVCSCKP